MSSLLPPIFSRTLKRPHVSIVVISAWQDDGAFALKAVSGAKFQKRGNRRRGWLVSGAPSYPCTIVPTSGPPSPIVPIFDFFSSSPPFIVFFPIIFTTRSWVLGFDRPTRTFIPFKPTTYYLHITHSKPNDTPAVLVTALPSLFLLNFFTLLRRQFDASKAAGRHNNNNSNNNIWSRRDDLNLPKISTQQQALTNSDVFDPTCRARQMEQRVVQQEELAELLREDSPAAWIPKLWIRRFRIICFWFWE